MFSLKSILKCTNQSFKNKGSQLIYPRQWHKEAIPVEWKRPEIGWIKLNFDGSSKGKSPGKASIGGVLRDHEAQFLLGYAESIGRANSTIAEFIALRKGIELVLENGWKRDVWLEGDSKALVEIIVQNKEVKCEETQSHIRYINSLILEFDNCMVTHIYREGNRVANRFASIGHRFKNIEIWRDIPPLETLELIREDVEGKIVFRKRRR